MSSAYPHLPPPRGPAASRRDAAGPPAPPAPPGSEGESRATAATWVAATGALLLLAAAATFLAVSWDTLGLAARITVVGAGTGAALLGGHHLRRQLPAVGAVVYHLGALLLPVDALGLALQTGQPLAGRWLAVGAVAVVAFPPLAAAGRSPVLGWAALAGIPVAATGVGLAGATEARVLVAGAALLALALPQAAGRLAGIRGLAAPLLALAAVCPPALVTAGAAAGLPGAAMRHLDVAGWSAGHWGTTLAVGAVAVAVVAAAATRRRSNRLAALACFAAVVTVVTAVLPAGTPRLALLVVPALGAVGVELAGLAARSDRLWARPTQLLAATVEATGTTIALPVVLVAALPGFVLRWRPDIELSITLGVLGLAWGVAALRHGLAGSGRRPSSAAAPAGSCPWLAPALAGSAGIHLAAMLGAARVGGTVATAVLLATAAATLLWAGERRWMATTDASGHVAAATAVLVLGAASVRSAGALLGTLVVPTVAVVLGAHVRQAALKARHGTGVLVAMLTPIAVGMMLVSGAILAVTGTGAAPLAGLLVACAVLVLAWLLDGYPQAADAVRVVAAVVGFVAVLPLGLAGAEAAAGASGPAAAAFALLRLRPDGLVVAGVVTVWLLVDAARLSRQWIAAFAAPVAVRLLGTAAIAAGLSLEAVGVLLWTAGVATAVLAVLGPRSWRPAAVTAAVVATPAGWWLLIGSDPALRALVLIATGVLVGAGGVLRRRPTVGHLGAAVATIGIWQLLVLHHVVALDVWLAPVAAQLWAAGMLLRSREPVSSWLTDVPPLLLVAIPAVLERIAGGPGWHSVLAGGVALFAVAAGGAQRLGGPLCTGTLLLLCVVGVETFAVVAAVPTWAWLAVGGAVLLGVAVAIERAGGSPATAARRVVDVVSERFH